MLSRVKKLFVFTFFICLLSAFAACNRQKENFLPPENIRVENDYLLWDATPHTEWYLVDIDGTEYEADEPSLDLFMITTEAKTYRIQIRSVGDDTFNYQKSAWSAPYEYKLESPPLLVREYKTGEYEIMPENRENLQGKIVIPSSVNGKPVTKIADSAFNKAKNITSVFIPDSVLEIDSSAFRLCRALQRIRMPENIKKLRLQTFAGCSSLQEVKIPVCDEIENAAFVACTSLKKIHIPQQVKKIGPLLFEYCNNLTEISVDEKNPFYKSEGNCIIEKATNKVIAGCNTSVIPDGVKIIGTWAFPMISLPNGITIPSSVEKIEYCAFYYCKNTSFFIPESVTTLETYCFADCTQLTSLEVAENNPVYKSEGNCIIEKATDTVIKGCNTSVIPQGVKIIGYGAFRKLQAEGIVIPQGVEIIAEEAFLGSTIKKVVLPDTLKEIRYRAFNECHSLAEAALPYGLTKIGAEAFYNTNLQYADIPETVKEIGTKAFSSHSFLTVLLPSCVENIGNTAFIHAITFVNATERECDTKSGWAKYTIMGTGAPWHNSNVVYECTFADDENGKYLYSWKYTYETDEETGEIFYFSGGAVGIPFRKGYKFLGFSVTEGSSVPDIVPTTHSEKYLDVFDFQQLKNYKNGTVFYFVWEAVDTAEE